MPINPKLMKILACPKCKGPVEFAGDEEIACHACSLVYPIRDGIPVMLMEEAVPLQGHE